MFSQQIMYLIESYIIALVENVKERSHEIYSTLSDLLDFDKIEMHCFFFCFFFVRCSNVDDNEIIK